ncbi:PaaI family thioesterase [Enterovirga rhinocerotis]|nr:PaaI family thioesterase [Enterovirga rhinocerotis]
MVHGGMVMTFADHALGLAARSVNRTHAQATVQLDTAFLSGVEEGEFVEARCRMLRETKSILFMSAEIAVGDRAVANATGLWKIRGPEATPRGSI